jgi:hypothetical protein
MSFSVSSPVLFGARFIRSFSTAISSISPSLSHVFITLQAADLKTNLEQLTGSILSSFVYVTLVSRHNRIMVASGNLIGKA